MLDLLLLPAGVAVGAINAVAGGGSLLSFPLLLALGYPPVAANVTNTVGIFACNASASWGYRRELRSELRQAGWLCALAAVASAVGAVALLTVGSSVFASLVPWMMLAAVGLVAAQPALVRLLRGDADRPVHRNWSLVAVAVAGLYGGYFGAAVGILLLALLGVCLHGPMQRINALKNVLALCVNAIDVVVFGLFGPVHWGPAGLLAIGTTVGGALGAVLARRAPEGAFRAIVVALGLLAAASMALR